MYSNFKIKIRVLRKFHHNSELAIFYEVGTTYCDIGIMEIWHSTVSYKQSADIIARIHKLPALGQCGVCLAWCVMGGENSTFPQLYRYSDIILSV